MKAVICNKYGPPEVLQLVEVEKRIPGDNEVLVRIKATVAAPPDCAFRKGDPFISRLFTGLTRPGKIPGDVLSGVIEKVGNNVSIFKTGDAVYGSSGINMGTNAEYIVLNEKEALAIKPERVTFEEAAAISEGSLTALPFLRDSGKIKKGQKVLIIGASGGVGVYAVQLAKYFGVNVTAVCGPSNVELVKSIGADKVIDYAKEDYTKSGEKYDIVFDAVSKSSFSRCRKILATDGIYLCTVPSLSIMLAMLWTSIFRSKTAVFTATGLRKPAEKKKDLAFLNQLIESGKLRAIIDRTYSLEQMAEAHRYVETGHKKGSVAIRIHQ
ncbi:MAG: NAD(P)-dependent alcohol dehydrogenase [Chitinophagales bacterium]